MTRLQGNEHEQQSICIWDLCNRETSQMAITKSTSERSVFINQQQPYALDQPDKYLQIVRRRLRPPSEIELDEFKDITAKTRSKKSGKKSVFQILRQLATGLESRSAAQTFGNILTSEQFKAIWTFLPSRFQIASARILFSTAVDGISVQTFLSRTNDAPATILVVKTTRGAVFGAFCSEPWSSRLDTRKDLTFFGSGETFLFCCSPRNAIYPWVGLTSQAESTASQVPAYFQAANSKTIVVGGGNGSAIGFESDLSRGFTGSCTTFANPPLCDEREFTTSLVEVYGLWS